ncbi:MAG: VCBS repeat-containing protein, partial [Phycisphaerae bacterium]
MTIIRTPTVRWIQGAAALIALAGAPPANGQDPHTTSQSAPHLVSALSHDATQRMVERLARIADEADVAGDSYLNDRRVDYYRGLMEQAPKPRDKLKWRLGLARERLFAGDPDAAIRDFRDILAELRRRRSRLDPAAREEMRNLVAVAYLRIAEQENCLARHNVDSCLFPIAGGGVHSEKRGAQRAAQAYMSILKNNPQDRGARWLLNLAHMALGEYPQGVPEQWLIPPDLFTSEFDLPRYYDIAPALGVDAVGLSGGSVMEDFDGDGDLDLMASSWGLMDQIRYFRNNADGTFTDSTEAAGLIGIVGGLNLVHADYNNDGHPDVLVLRGAWRGAHGRPPNSLLRNNGDGTFSDVTEAAGLLSFHPTQTAAWGDYDNDGRLDLFIGNETTEYDLAPDGTPRTKTLAGAAAQRSPPHPCEL